MPLQPCRGNFPSPGFSTLFPIRLPVGTLRPSWLRVLLKEQLNPKALSQRFPPAGRSDIAVLK